MQIATEWARKSPPSESREKGTTPHRRACAWCGEELKAGEEPTSHGICQACKREVEQDLEPDPYDVMIDRMQDGEGY